MQILSIFLKLQAAEQGAPTFWPTLYMTVHGDAQQKEKWVSITQNMRHESD